MAKIDGRADDHGVFVVRRQVQDECLVNLNLETPAILSPDQIKTYNRLRGY